MDLCEAFNLKFGNRNEAYPYKQIEFLLDQPPPQLSQLFRAGHANQVAVAPPEVAAVVPIVAPEAAPAAPIAVPQHGVMVHFTGQSRLNIRSRNNKNIALFRLPGAKHPIDKFKHFNRIFPKQTATPLVTHLGGSLAKGVYHLTKTLYQLDKHACVSSIRDCGHDTFRKLNPAETIAVMDIAKISINQKNKIASILRLHNNKRSVFASAKSCAKLRSVHDAAPTFGEYTYEEPYDHLPNEKKTIKVPYWYVCPYDSLLATIKTSRDSNIGDIPIGVKQGKLGECIPVIIQGDYGGTIGQGEMKWIEVVILRKGEVHEKFLGSIHGKEDFTIMKETIMPHINAGVKKMNENKILLLTWDNQFDFVTVPVGLDINTINYIRLNNKLRAMWHDGHADFDREDIPDARAVRAVRVVPFSGGDLAYQFAILGRTSHSPSKCMCCNLHKREWQKYGVCGKLFKTEEMLNDYREWEQKYIAARALLPNPEEGPSKEQYIKDAVSKVKMYGMKGLYLPMSQYLVPPLHILLGVGNDLLGKIDEFIAEYLEKTYLNIPAKAKRPTPMRDAVYAMLKKYEVEPQKYFTQTLVGGDIHRLLQRHSRICTDMQIIMLNGALRKMDVQENVDELVREFVKKIRNLMQVLESTHQLLSKVDQLQADELNDFEELCLGFGRLWRESFGNKITPKLHLLEVHAPMQMREFGCIGDKTEAAIERLHQLCNVDNRILCHTKNYEKRTNAQLSRKRLAAHHEVVKSKRSYKEQRLRVMSPDSVQRRTTKATAKSASKRTKRTAALDVINLVNDL